MCESQRELDYQPHHQVGVKPNHQPPLDDTDNHTASDTEDSNLSDYESPRPQRPSPLTPLTPSSPPKYPSDLKTHHCPYTDCSKSFNRPARLAEHLRSHTNERPFHCKHPGCDKTFLRDTHLSHHIKSAHTDVRDYTCDWDGCGKKFLTATRLRRHLAAHEGREKYRCTQHPPCNETFRKHSTLQKHIASVHLKQKPYPCTKIDETTGQPCTHGFETAGKLRAHEGRIHGGARFWCSECVPDASSSNSAPDDLNDSQDQDPDQEQEQAQGLGFPTYALLQAHIRTAHPPICPTCQHPCATPRDLAQHLEIHHGSQSLSERKTHLCMSPDCDRAFTKKGNLTIHLRTVHGGERRFVCGETDLSSSKDLEGWDAATQGACGGRFATKGGLEEHVRTVHLRLPGPRRAGRNLSSAASTPSEKGRKREQKQKQPSALSRLTGAGYGEESGRHIACPEAGCAYRFFRDYDLDLHLRAHHGIADSSSQLVRDGSAGRAGYEMKGEIRLGMGYINDDDEVAETEVGRVFALDVEAELERMAGLGGEFWVGGLVHGEEQRGVGEISREEMDEMVGQAVEKANEGIVTEGAGEDEVIDPVLRYLQMDVGPVEG